jgi:RHS repeat-associated protein
VTVFRGGPVCGAGTCAVGNVGVVVVLHMNWGGLFSLGINAAGGTSTTPVEWPCFRTTANHSMGETQAITKNWMGSLLEGQRDAGGQMYMRNRYYDPATGQFTQADPIGIAGGLNTYGFANGDPVSYSDPYGLCIRFWLKRCRERSSDLTTGDALHAAMHLALASGSADGGWHAYVLGTLQEVQQEGRALTNARSRRLNRDQRNAFRHIWGACTLTQKLGEEEARHSTNAHEQQARHGSKKQDADEQADRANNERGFIAARISDGGGASCEAIADMHIRLGDYSAR